MRFDTFDAKEFLAKYKELSNHSIDETKEALEFNERLLFGSASTHTEGFLYVDEESKLVQSRAWEGQKEEKKQAVIFATAHNMIVLDDPRSSAKDLNDFTVTEPGRKFLALKAIVETTIPEPPTKA